MHNEHCGRKIYWDSCIFISLLQKEKDRFVLLSEIWDEIDSKETVIYTSAITYLEIVKDSDGESPLAGAELQQVLSMLDKVKIVNLDRMLSRQAKSIEALHGVKSFDAAHLAAASMAKVQEFHTYDGSGNRKRAEDLLKLKTFGDPPFKICLPSSCNPLIDTINNAGSK